MTERPEIRLKAGDDRAVRIGIQGANGNARDLTGEFIEFRAAPCLNSTNSTIYKVDGDGVQVVDATGGVVDIIFTPEDTEHLGGQLLLWEIRVHDVAGKLLTLDWVPSGDPKTFGFLRIEAMLLVT